MFPDLPGQSGYNKRLNAAGPVVARLLTALAAQVPTWHQRLRLIDSTPLPCAASRQTVRRSELAGHAGYGPAGVFARTSQRLLALAAALWHNWETNAPVKRSLIAYDH